MTTPGGRDPSDVTNSQTAVRLIELVRDLGECVDSKQVLLTAGRHYRQLFGDFNMATMLLEIDSPGHWQALVLESPYTPSWGGTAHHQIPPDTDLDEIVKRIGRDVTDRIVSDPVLAPRLISNQNEFWCCDNLVAVRLTAILGCPSRSYMVVPWRRPEALAGWIILGYSESRIVGDDALELFHTVAQVTARLSMYPALVNYIDRKERMTQALRRNLVHDLKTPITVIKGFAETLEHDEVARDTLMRAEFLGAIIESCTRLLDDLKEIIEPVSSTYQPNYEMFDVAHLLQRVVMAERHTERAKHHTIELLGTEDEVLAQADQRKLRRVVENLLSNAVKYSPGTGKTVTVTLTKHEDEFQIDVADQGIGMTEEQLARVMNDVGRVVDDGLGIEGSGFGLDSARMVVEGHNGRILGKSTHHKGTTFSVFVPLRKVAQVSR